MNRPDLKAAELIALVKSGADAAPAIVQALQAAWQRGYSVGRGEGYSEAVTQHYGHDMGR